MVWFKLQTESRALHQFAELLATHFSPHCYLSNGLIIHEREHLKLVILAKILLAIASVLESARFSLQLQVYGTVHKVMTWLFPLRSRLSGDFLLICGFEHDFIPMQDGVGETTHDGLCEACSTTLM